MSKQLLSLIGLKAQQIESLDKEGITDEELHAIADEYLNERKAIIEKETIAAKKSSFQAEAWTKAKKQLLTELGIEADELKDETDFSKVLKVAIPKYAEGLTKPSGSETELQKEVERLRNEYKDSQKLIKQLEVEKSQAIEQGQTIAQQEINKFKVDLKITELLSKDDVEFIIPREKALKIFKGMSVTEGISFKQNEQGQYEVYKGEEPLSRQVDGSRAKEFYTLETYMQDSLSDFIKKSNGGGGNGTTNNTPTKNINLDPIAARMLAQSEKM